MKIKNKIIIVIVAYFVVLIATYFSVNSYINAKDDRLCREIRKSIITMFGGDRLNFVDVDYHGKNVVFNQMAIPEQPSKKLSPETKKIRIRTESIDDSNLAGAHKDFDIDADWKNNYGDLYKLYHCCPLKNRYRSLK